MKKIFNFSEHPWKNKLTEIWGLGADEILNSNKVIEHGFFLELLKLLNIVASKVGQASLNGPGFL